MNIIVGIPTRGAITTQTVKAMWDNIRYYETLHPMHSVRPIFTWDMPIPGGHAYIAHQLMQSPYDAVWYLEEDVVPPPDTLHRLVCAAQLGAHMAFMDYPMSGGIKGQPNCYHRNPRGEITWTGFGCTLITRQAFEMLPQPWFRTDVVGSWLHKGTDHETVIFKPGKAVYGGFDIYFGWQLREAGGKLEVLEGMAEHIKLKALGQREVNDGLHQMEHVSSHEL